MAKKEAKKAEPKKDKADDIGGVMFVGCLFLGLAVGMYQEHVAVGALAGLGVGFVLMAFVKMLMKK